MLEWLIKRSMENRGLVLMLTLLLAVWGVISLRMTPLDAIPDLSDVQVIVKTPYPGQSPAVIEDQVTYPISTTMLKVPGATAVRGYSFFGDSYVYVIFDDSTDLYWARSRVLEYLNQAAANLPAGARPALGPDATGVGWVYAYALKDTSGQHDLSQLRSLQDWFLKQELQTVPGVAEIATVGGMVKRYEVVASPDRLRAYNIPLARLREAIRNANQETGGSVLEIAEAEYMIRGRGYLGSVADIETIPVAVSPSGTPILIRDVARVQLGPDIRRGIAELDGQGEVTGGFVVMRYGENALEVIKRVKQRLESLKAGLPPGVEIVETYDRSALIERAVANLGVKLGEEFLIVALVCVIFLYHLRSALVAIISLPLGVLAAFIVMHQQGINANIMSLGGIAIAIGAMVDAAIVMIENGHKHLERYSKSQGEPLTGELRWRVLTTAAAEVGPALFFSLLIITLSFLPIFALEAQEGRLFKPLAFTKTYAMAAAAGLSVTLVPVLMGYLIRGKIPAEESNPISRFLIALYRPALGWVLRWPKLTLALSVLVLVSTVIPFTRLGSEFMPELEEGDLLYMPTTLPGLSIGKAQELLQQTDRLIRTLPEVKTVFGKIGRAETATDPAPLTMIETTIQLHDKSQWRPGMTMDKLIAELEATVKFPGLTNAWVQPIKTRIDMLATGIKTPVGIKVAGDDLAEIERVGRDIEAVLAEVSGTVSAYSERVAGGRYIEVVPDRAKAARYGLNISDINLVIGSAVGGARVTETIEGLERYPVTLRYPRDTRDSIDKLRNLPLVTPVGAHIPLAEVAEIRYSDGPPMIKSENARLNGWTFVDIAGVDLGSYIREAQQVVQQNVKLPPGYSITWSGQYEYLLRAKQRFSLLIPLVLLLVFVLLFMTFRRFGEALIVMTSLPFAVVGGFWLLWWLDFHLSVAVIVGFIALAGVAAEFGVVMLLYLNTALRERVDSKTLKTVSDLKQAIMEGAVMRVRPKAMTVAVIVAGLIPVMIGSGTGSDVMQRIAAPMIGGMITAPLLSLFVIPAIFLLWQRLRLRDKGSVSGQG
ncbi:MAG: efflux RND transporter permease subunit [Thiotrichales bacterium]